MNQIELIDAAKQQQGLTSDYKLAQVLGVRPGRISDLRTQGKPADEAEIMMLADLAGIDPHIAFAAVHAGREKNPAKRAYWEKISMQFASIALAVTLVFTGFAGDARAGITSSPAINYAKFTVWKNRLIRRFKSLTYALVYRIAHFQRQVNA